MRTAIAATRCPTKLHRPQPLTANATATTPLTTDDAKTILDIEANRIWRVSIVFWITHSALIGSSRKKTGATTATEGIA